jgi:xylan 1,4-beta-xylosidase
MNRCAIPILAFLLLQPAVLFAQEIPPIDATVQVDAAKPIGPLHPIYRFFGADEPNYATMTYGKQLIGEIGQLGPDPAYFRTHNLLNSGDGTAAFKWGSTGIYSEDKDGKPIYNYTIVDGIFDTYIKNGVHPYVEVGFIPKELSPHPDPYQHSFQPGGSGAGNNIFTGWAYPPTDYGKWGELVYQWASHCKQRYGDAEVAKWYWETWNEPNIGYWKGTVQEFYKLHDTAVDAVRRAIPNAKVGGPDSAGASNPWFHDFLAHCVSGTNLVTGKIGTPTDFISFHAKGSPSFVDNHVRMGISNELNAANTGFTTIATFPTLKNLPIVIGECDPDGCAACTGPQLGYRNTPLYAAYTAAAYSRILDLADQHGVNIEGALTWAFEFENQPLFFGQRTLATDGVDLPVFNVFRMLGKMHGQRITATSSAAIPLQTILRSGVRAAPDISAMASQDDSHVCVLLCNYHDDDIPGPAANITLTISGLPATLTTATLDHYRIDLTHSDSFTAWKTMGSPATPTPAQFATLRQAGQLANMSPSQPQPITGGKTTLDITLPRQGVSLIVLTYAQSPTTRPG